MTATLRHVTKKKRSRQQLHPGDATVRDARPVRRPTHGYLPGGRASPHPDDAMDVVQPVCPSQSSWRALDAAVDINNSAVRVYQPSRDHRPPATPTVT